MGLVGAAALLAITSVAASGAVPDHGENHFFPGYCTWDAAEQAHRAWGMWVPWYGDAGDWIEGARAAGWRVSAAPQVGSIVAMPRSVQGSGPDGHVGWVLGIQDVGAAVLVRSMNWSRRGAVTVHQLKVDGRVRFITPRSVGSRLAPRMSPA